MSESTYVGSNIKSFESGSQLDGYTRVVMSVSDDVEYIVGDELGRTLHISNPWGSQQVASDVLDLIKGFQYQPYTAAGAQVDLAAELGDGIHVHSVYSGLYSQRINFNRLALSDISAPAEKTLEHEYPYKSRTEKRIIRESRLLRTELSIQTDRITAEIEDRAESEKAILTTLELQSGLIEAKVSRTGGDASSFGWNLTDSDWTIKANNLDVLKATKEGLAVYGRIVATGGSIGGFDIEDTYLSYNNQTWGGTNTVGSYFGVSGIQLGQNFKVDSAGNLYATSGTFTGNVRAGSIQYGGENGTLTGAALTPRSISGGSSGQVATNTLGTVNLVPGINTSLGYADFANGVFNGYSEAPFIRSLRIDCSGQVSAAAFQFKYRKVDLSTINVMTADGGTAQLRYLSWSY